MARSRCDPTSSAHRGHVPLVTSGKSLPILPGVELRLAAVEPGVRRILSDGVRDVEWASLPFAGKTEVVATAGDIWIILAGSAHRLGDTVDYSDDARAGLPREVAVTAPVGPPYRGQESHFYGFSPDGTTVRRQASRMTRLPTAGGCARRDSSMCPHRRGIVYTWLRSGSAN